MEVVWCLRRGRRTLISNILGKSLTVEQEYVNPLLALSSNVLIPINSNVPFARKETLDGVAKNDKKMTGKKGAEALGMSVRQVRQIWKKYEKKGAAGLVTKNRGKPSNNRLPNRWFEYHAPEHPWRKGFAHFYLNPKRTFLF